MPKKWVGENSKAASAKARKASVRADEEQKRRVKEEEEQWKDDDKQVARKQQRKEERERKKLEQDSRKAEKQALMEQEERSLQVPSKQSASKVTQAQIQAELERREAAAKAASQSAEAGGKVPKAVTKLAPLEENVNRLVVDGEEARSVGEAIAVLSVRSTPQEDRHPERRLKAALATFEERRLPQLRAENPNMRMSQVKQMLRKEWLKSPDNPVNQALAHGK